MGMLIDAISDINKVTLLRWIISSLLIIMVSKRRDNVKSLIFIYVLMIGSLIYQHVTKTSDGGVLGLMVAIQFWITLCSFGINKCIKNGRYISVFKFKGEPNAFFAIKTDGFIVRFLLIISGIAFVQDISNINHIFSFANYFGKFSMPQRFYVVTVFITNFAVGCYYAYIEYTKGRLDFLPLYKTLGMFIVKGYTKITSFLKKVNTFITKVISVFKKKF